MKKIILFALLVTSLSSFAQYAPPKGWKSPELYLPTTIILSTFSINHVGGYSLTEKQRSSIAITGMASSVVTHFVFRKIRENKVFKRKSHNKFLTLHK